MCMEQKSEKCLKFSPESDIPRAMKDSKLLHIMSLSMAAFGNFVFLRESLVMVNCHQINLFYKLNQLL